MNLEKVFTVEVLSMGILLLTILIIGLIILIKMKPLQSFNEIKLGKFELKKNLKDLERDQKQDDTLDKLVLIVTTLEHRLDDIDKHLLRLDKRSDAQYDYTKNAAINAANGVVWSDKGAPFLEVIKAGLLNIMLGQNGNLIDRMVDVIMGFGNKGVETYRSTLNEFIDKNRSKLDSYFWDSIKRLEAKIY